MSTDPFKVQRARQIADQADPVTIYGPADPITGKPTIPVVQLSGSNVVDGTAWEQGRLAYRVGPIQKLSVTTYDGSGQIVHPSVVYIAEGFKGYKWWMAFTPYPNSNDTFENPSVRASNDGINWELPSGMADPVVPAPPNTATHFNRDPELVIDRWNSRLVLYWALAERSGGDGSAWRTYTTDGVTWSAPEQLTIADVSGASPKMGALGAIRHSTGFMAWESGGTPEGQVSRMESQNGKDWWRLPPAITNQGGKLWHPSVMPEGDGLHFLFSSFPVNARGSEQGQALYYGFSLDGGASIYVDSAPLLTPNPADWTNGAIYRSAMTRYGEGLYRVYFSAMDRVAGKTWSLGCFDVRLTGLGRNAPKLGERAGDKHSFPLVTNAAIRDTTQYFINRDGLSASPVAGKTPLPLWNRFAHRALYVANTTDQPIEIRLLANPRGPTLYDTLLLGEGEAAAAAMKVTVPASPFSPRIITSASLKGLDTQFADVPAMTVKATSTPTTGALTVKLLMWN